MKIKSPTLNCEEEATPQGIAEIIPMLKERPDPFAILQQTEQTYVQTVWTPNGYDLEYQDKDILHHYQVMSLLTQEQVISIFQSYLAGDNTWKSDIEFQEKRITDCPFRLGHALGKFCGSFVRAFREARRKREFEQRR